MVEAVFYFWMWLFMGTFNGYDFHNCEIVPVEAGPIEVICGPPHTHDTPRSIRQR